MFGPWEFSEQDFHEWLGIIKDHGERYSKTVQKLARWQSLLAIFGATLCSALLDKVIVATILGGSFWRFFLTVLPVYSVLVFSVSGAFYDSLFAAKYANNRTLKLKVFFNSLFNSTFTASLYTLGLFLFVVALRLNLRELAMAANANYGVPPEFFSRFFKYVPFIVFHFACLGRF